MVSFHVGTKSMRRSCRFGKRIHISMISNSVTHLRRYTNSSIAGNSAPAPMSPRVVASNGECFVMFHNVLRVFHPRWKINSFLSEISVCWSCMEKITIKIERAFFVILRASSAIRRSFQPLPQHPTVPQQTLDWQLQMQNGVFQATPLLTLSAICHLHVDINIY